MHDQPLLVELADALHQLNALQRLEVFVSVAILVLEPEAVVKQQADGAPLGAADAANQDRVLLQSGLIVCSVIGILINHDVLELFASEFFLQILDEELLLINRGL